MAMPGWVRVGLWLRDKEEPSDLYQVIEVKGNFVWTKEKEPGSGLRKTRWDYLHSVFLASNFFECDDCRRKPGSPVLCSDCLERRSELPRKIPNQCRLPRLCDRAYHRGFDSIPLEPANEPDNQVIPTRYERKWVI
jgi:hypothetical protein